MNDSGYDVVGIDLGTTNSCVAVWKNGQIAIVPNEVGKRTTPSIVSFLPTETLIGNSAAKKKTSNYKNTVYDCKRLIGRKVSDPEIQQDVAAWPFQVLSDPDGNPLITIENSSSGKKSFTPEEISAMILHYLKVQAENFLGKSIKDAVITVPAYFDDSQRKATEKAAHIAGFNVLRILDEPTAAALAYNFEQSETTQRILVYDLGGGTFDVSILEVGKQKVNVLASDGDNHLGGEDFDNKLIDYLFFKYKQDKGVDMSKDRLWRARMYSAVEACKIELSVTSSSLIEFENSDFTYSVSRFLFENLNKDLFNRTIQVLENTLTKANLTKEMIDGIVLVGGSTRIPRIQQLLHKYFPSSKMCKSVNPDEAVAMGGAIMAAVAATQRLRAFPEVAVESFGIETQGGLMEVMIPINAPLPAVCSYEFVTPTDYQSWVEFRVAMGERRLVRDNVVLGVVKLADLQLGTGDETVVSVTMTLSEDYHLQVIATESVTHRRSTFNINLDKKNEKSPLRLTEEQRSALVEEAERMRARDEDMVARHVAMNTLECVVEEGYALLHDRDRRMTIEWIGQMRGLLDGMKKWMAENEDAEVYECQEREQLIRKNLLSFSKLWRVC